MRILYLEPFEAGSHAAFTRWLTEGIDADWTVLTLPGRHWKWRMRGAAAWFARASERELAAEYDIVFASSYLPLAELVALAPALTAVPRVLYFHENQLAFPVRREHVGGPDYHFGFTQMVSCLAADRVVFNSEYNRRTFLDGATRLLARMPDAVAPGWVEAIDARSAVLPLPIAFPRAELATRPAARAEPAQGPLLLWNHRWEHDKNPKSFFDALGVLADEGVPFRVAVVGQRFGEAPPEFERGRVRLGTRVVRFGPAERSDYERLLGEADVCVSTAAHEFFGVSVLEAMHCGVRPLVPDRLAYRETVPAEFRYADDGALVQALRTLVRRWQGGEALRGDFRAHTRRFAAEAVLPRYRDLLAELAEARRRS